MAREWGHEREARLTPVNGFEQGVAKERQHDTNRDAEKSAIDRIRRLARRFERAPQNHRGGSHDGGHVRSARAQWPRREAGAELDAHESPSFGAR